MTSQFFTTKISTKSAQKISTWIHSVGKLVQVAHLLEHTAEEAHAQQEHPIEEALAHPQQEHSVKEETLH